MRQVLRSLAVLALALSFVPLFADVVISESVTRSLGSLWETAGQRNGEPAVLGLTLIGVLVLLLVVATFRPQNPVLPVGIVLTSVVLVLMLLTKPGTGDPAPDLSNAGALGLVAGVGMIALAPAHAVHAFRRLS